MNNYSCFQKLTNAHKMTLRAQDETNLKQWEKYLSKQLRKVLKSILYMLREENKLPQQISLVRIRKVEELLKIQHLPEQIIKKIYKILSECKQKLPQNNKKYPDEESSVKKPLHLLHMQLYLNPKELCGSRNLLFHSRINLSQLRHSYLKAQLQQIYVKDKNKCNVDKIDKLLCAGFNDNTTYVLIGLNKDNLIEGQVLYEEEKQIIEREFKVQLQLLHPKSLSKQLNFSFIPVVKDDESPQEQKYEAGRYFILIQMISLYPEMLYFQKTTTNKIHLCEVYVKNEQNKICKIKGETLYKFLHFKHSNRPKIKKAHYYCSAPQIGNKLYKEIKLENNQEINLKNFNYAQKLNKGNQTLFIVPNKNKDEYVETFFKKMKSNNSNNYDYLKPFPQMQKKMQKSFWLFSHKDRHKIIQDATKKYDKNRAITLQSFQTDISFPESNKAQFEEKLNQFFALHQNLKYKVLQKKIIKEQSVFKKVIRFEQWSNALYTYMYIFSQFKLKLTFFFSLEVNKAPSW